MEFATQRLDAGRALWLVLATTLLAASLGARQRRPSIVQPATYEAPGGRFELRVEPSDRAGVGPAAYALRRDGEEVWSRELPVTLSEADVDDAGFVGGYAYSEGLWGLGRLHLVVLTPGGEVLVDEALPRATSRWMHAPPDPVARGVFVHDDRAVFRLFDREQEELERWRVVSLPSGERRPDVVPSRPLAEEGGRSLRLEDVCPVPETPLRIEHWWVSEPDTELGRRREGGLFVLSTPAGEPVWRHLRFGDYTDPVSEAAHDQLTRRVRFHGAIVDVGPGPRFDVWHVSDGERVRFAVRAASGADEVVVEPVEREEYDPVEETPVLPLSLTALEPVPLSPAGGGSEGPVRDVVAFGFSGAGNIELVRREGRAGFRFLRLADDGEAELETPLPIPVTALEHGDPTVRWFDGGGDDWWRVVQRYGRGEGASLARVDVRTGAAREVPDWSGGRVDHLDATSDGGFVAVVREDDRHSISYSLVRADALGRERWRADSPSGGVCETSSGTVVTADPVADVLELLSPAGERVGEVDLATAFGGEPAYPSRLASDGGGGVFVVDGGKLWQVDLDGSPVGVREPRDDAGAEVRVRHLAVGPEGDPWISDGTMIARVSPDGSLSEVAGTPPEGHRLTDPLTSRIDPLGRILVRDRRTGAVHVFGGYGAPIATCALEPSERGGRIWVTEQMSVDTEGRVYVVGGSETHVAFSADGARVGPLDLGSRWAQHRPGSHEVWGVPRWEHRLVRTDPGAPSTEVRRMPDGRWFEDILDFAFSTDGSTLAALDGERLFAERLGVYEGRGRPLFQLRLPEAAARHVAVGRGWIVLWAWSDAVHLVRLADRALLRAGGLPEGSPPNRSMTWGFSPEGHELWGLDNAALVLHRYELPR